MNKEGLNQLIDSVLPPNGVGTEREAQRMALHFGIQEYVNQQTEKECEKISEASIKMTNEEIEAREEKIKELEEWQRCQNLKTKDRAGEWNALVNKQARHDSMVDGLEDKIDNFRELKEESDKVLRDMLNYQDPDGFYYKSIQSLIDGKILKK